MSKNLTNKKRLSKVENTGKTFKIFAVSFHGTNLEVMKKELVRQMEVCSSKKIYAVMVNGTDTDGDQTISEATDLEHQAHQIEEGIQRCKKDFESVWQSLTRTLSEDLRCYWSEDMEDVSRDFEKKDGDKSFDNPTEEVFPKKIKKSDLEILNSEIRNIRTCDYFVVLFGQFSTEVLIKLVISNQPLQAIIHFIRCPESNLEVNFPKLHKDIDFLRKSPDTKNVGIFIETLIQIPVAIAIANPGPSTITTTSEYLVEHQEEQKYSQQIYDQFTWYLYDIEMLTQQFIVYQTDFVEINDAELPSQEELLWSKFVEMKEVESSNKDTNDVDDDTPAVGVFLDNLFSTIENRANLGRKNSLCHLSPFLENNYGKIIVEEANELLRSAVANQLNVVTYWKLVNMVVNMVTSSVCGKHTEIDFELPEFYELLSWESFVQTIEAKKVHYDECCHVDMTEECKLFILKRSFNKVVEVKKKFHLPTRPCLRDFCRYIAPDLPNVLRNFKAHNNGRNSHQDFTENPKFSGLVFNDTLQELTVVEKIFRFEDGLISCSVEAWSNEDQMVSIRIQLFKSFFYFYPWERLYSNSSKIRLVTKNNISCNIEIYKNEIYPNIFIQWPNGCQVRYIHEDSLKAVEQSYQSRDGSELKRLYTLDGCVIRYLINEQIEVLTPNGIVYIVNVVDNTSFTDFENSSSQEEVHKVSDEIDFVRNLEKYGIYCKRFEVTLADGRKLMHCLKGDIVEEIANFMVYEWTDYCEGKKFLDRDDGVKMVWSSDSLRCYYPCGTIITTKTVEDCIKTNFECEINIMDNIFHNINPRFVAKGANKAKRHDSYTTYNLNYLMQHKNYATVEVCGKDKMEIHSPNGFKLILKEDDDDDGDNHHPVNVVLIDIEEEISFRIAAGVCTIRSGVSILENKKFELKLNMFPDETEILSFQNQNFFLKLDVKGEMKLNEINCGLSSYEETSYLLAKQYSFGIEFISKEKYDTLLPKFKSNKYLYSSPTQIVLLKSILPIDEQFLMSNPTEIEKDLKHFQPVVYHHSRLKPEVSDHIFTAKVINKLQNFPTMETLKFVQNINFNETTLGNQLNAALNYFFGERVVKPKNPKWKSKINALQEDLLYKKQRKRIYNTMLKHNTYPKYYELKEFNDDVKLLNVEKLVQLNNLN